MRSIIHPWLWDGALLQDFCWLSDNQCTLLSLIVCSGKIVFGYILKKLISVLQKLRMVLKSILQMIKIIFIANLPWSKKSLLILSVYDVLELTQLCLYACICALTLLSHFINQTKYHQIYYSSWNPSTIIINKQIFVLYAS